MSGHQKGHTIGSGKLWFPKHFGTLACFSEIA